jgi:hypothetical protein
MDVKVAQGLADAPATPDGLCQLVWRSPGLALGLLEVDALSLVDP